MTIIFVIVFFISCTTHSRWTEEQKKEFAEKCSKTDTVSNLGIILTGYSFNEVENIVVKQMKNGQTMDSFYIHPDSKIYSDTLRKQLSATIDKTLCIKDTFKFIGLDRISEKCF